MPKLTPLVVLVCFCIAVQADEKPRRPAAKLPKPGTVIADRDRDEVILSAKVQHPRDKPCIGSYGKRIQAFVGCAKAAGGDAKMVDYLVFLVDVPTEEVHKALVSLGAKSRVSYSMQEGHKRSGLKPIAATDNARMAIICDVGTRKELFRLKGHTGPVYAVAFTPDDSRLLTGSGDRTVRVWDVRTGKVLDRLTGHQENVCAVAVSSSGNRVTSGGDGRFRLWNLKSTTNP